MQIPRIFRRWTVFLVLLGVGADAGFSDEVINDVVAIVGNRPVTQLDLDEEIAKIVNDKNFQRDGRNLKSQALDELIKSEIIQLILEEEFITVSDTQIETAIQHEMKSANVSDIGQFEQLLRQERNISLAQYREMVRERLEIQNVVQLRVEVEVPTPEQVERWYKKNRANFGKKYRVRLIRMQYNTSSVQDEMRVNDKMKEARALALKDFVSAAKTYSDHPSGNSGGYLGWVMPSDLARMENTDVARMLFQLKDGSVSQIFVAKGAYYIIKIERSMFPSLDDIREIARQYVYVENQQSALNAWLSEARKHLSIQILIEGYQKP